VKRAGRPRSDGWAPGSDGLLPSTPRTDFIHSSKPFPRRTAGVPPAPGIPPTCTIHRSHSPAGPRASRPHLASHRPLPFIEASPPPDRGRPARTWNTTELYHSSKPLPRRTAGVPPAPGIPPNFTIHRSLSPAGPRASRPHLASHRPVPFIEASPRQTAGVPPAPGIPRPPPDRSPSYFSTPSQTFHRILRDAGTR